MKNSTYTCWLHLLFGSVLVSTSACSGWIEKRAAASTVTITRQSTRVVQRMADVELARAAAPGGLVQLEAFHLAYPKERGFVELLAEAYCQYGVGFVNDEWEQAVMREDMPAASVLQGRALLALDRCVEFGLKLLGTRWQAAYAAGPKALETLAAQAGRASVPGLAWVGLGLATAVGLNPFDSARRAFLSTAQALLERVVILDEGHRDATAHVLLGALLSARSKLLGGDPEAGKRHFTRAQQLTQGKSLLVDVMLARTYAVTTGDRELFRRALNRVLAADVKKWPERRLVNEMARIKALRYLAAEASFF